MERIITNKMRIKFSGKKLHYWADRYGYPVNDNQVIKLIPIVKNNGYLTKSQLFKVCKWKSPRSAGHVKKNSIGFIKEITSIALSTQEERTKIEILTLLNGVNWPSASVILHFFHNDLYPILDFRALWSLGIEKVPAQYTFEFWWKYVSYCRELSLKHNIDMRTLDKALWQYSKENQNSTKI